MKQKILLIMFMVIAISIKSQTRSLINLVSTTFNGVTDTVNLAPIIINSEGNPIVATNEKVSPSQYDARTAEQLSNGIVAWTNLFNTSTEKCFITASTTDDKENIYVCGGIRVANSGTGIDFFVIKYDMDGNQIWVYYYNGPNNTTDCASDIIVDASYNVYVTGVSDGTGTSVADYATIKLDANGNQSWVTRYDNGSFDVPYGIELSGTRLVVTGSSALAFNDWDVTTITYNAITGNQDNIDIQAYGASTDMVFGMVTDSSGNVYTTGRTANNIEILKLDTALNTVWVKSFDGYGFDDAGLGIALDDSLNVLVTGFSCTDTLNSRELVVLKYDNSGNFKWKVTRPIQNSTSAEGIKIVAKSADEIFVGGNQTVNNNQDLIILRYNKKGEQTLEKLYNGPSNAKDKLLDMAVTGNTIYVSARTYSTGSLDQNITLTYEYLDINEAVSTSTTIPKHISGHFIISFKENMVDTTLLNKRDIKFGLLSSFITAQAKGKLDTLLQMNTADIKAYKCYPDFRKKDSMSLSRCGHTVKLFPFYTTLVVMLPASGDDTLTQRLLRNEYQLVVAADMNLILNLLIANDPEYSNGESAGLDATSTYSVSDINLSPAWAVEAGNPNTIVGIFDTGINYSHDDFNGSGLASSKVVTGYNYHAGSPTLAQPVDKIGHGTSVAGLIGAIRNNNKNIAGVAGGDASNSNTGVTLNDMKIFQGQTNSTDCSIPATGVPLNISLRAMIDGAVSSASAGIGLAQHAQNHSYEISSINGIPDTMVQSIKIALRNVFANEVLLAFGSGNGQNSSFTQNYFNRYVMYKDEWMLNVGALDSSGGRLSISSGGKYLDFLAPGHKSLYNSLHKANNSATTDTVVYGLNNACVRWINGTSFAAPHALGVGALMISYINNQTSAPNKIAPEDVEHIMEANITDMTAAPFAAGYDAQSGHGRLNAGPVLQKIKFPEYQVKHYNINTTLANCSIALTASLESVNFPNNWNGFIQGYGVVNRYEISYTNSHSVGTYSIMDAWKRDAMSNLPGIISVPQGTITATDGTNDLPNETNIVLDSYNNSSAILKGYVYEVMKYDTTTFSYIPSGFWFPFDTTNASQQIKFAYTLHLHDPVLSVKEKNVIPKYITVYPNPSSDQINISYSGGSDHATNIKLFDITGRLLREERVTLKSYQTYTMNTASLINGIYFVNLTMDTGESQTFKQIITH